MTCDDLLDRLFALPDPGRPPADVRAHLSACPACVAVQTALAGVEASVRRLSVPDSSGAKAAFLAQLNEPAPIIVLNRSAPRRNALTGVRWPHLAGLAAAVMVVVGGWYGTRPTPVAPVAAARHDLLQKEVRNVVRLTNAGSAADRMVIWADAATDLHAELGAVYQVAREPDLDLLATLFRRAVEDGVLTQARRMPEFLPAPERHAKLTEAAQKLGDVEREAKRLLAIARPQARDFLARVAMTARDGKEVLDKLDRGEKA